MELIFTYIVTLITFLAMDYVGLSFFVRPIFERFVGNILLEQIRIFPALAFYSIFVFGVVWFVSAPALENGTGLRFVLPTAAFLGFLAYGTYEFTNLSTLRGWNWSMVIVDLAWGCFLTGTAATVGVALTRLVMG
ncbi:MAG: DUF2177 family protein [Pseudomonadota bacterium]